ncbi:HAD-IIIC family phosphatase [Scytonema sp. UIC 10036]|uniref:HAD-IIIC family phosphatase n=1 Tax=Scytonema sp. UIC 10036 TaxID=2304196 RepID=UPI0012DA1557|nr:HAD-IIIC family phosphatase [Scytonema sp. UIC 10036]
MSVTIRSLRLAILCSFNLELIARKLEATLNQRGFDIKLYFSGYGQWEANALNPSSELYQFAPDIVVLFAEFSDLIPSDSVLLSEEAEKVGEKAWQRSETVVSHLLHNLPPQSIVLCHNTIVSSVTPLGLLEGNAGYCLNIAAETFNRKLRDRCKTESRLLLFDYATLVAKHGWQTWCDRRLWHLGRIRLARTGLNLLANEYTRYIAALFTPSRKCLVLDLDNTLWGGVIGEDGLLGIQLGHEGIGLAYREFQMAALALSQRGVILAVCSKNNPDDAMAVLREHPDTILHPEHFACMEINWEPKPENLRRIAKKLNIGLDSLVFWDDSPVEREIVSHQLPEVLVVDVPDDPSDYVAQLLELECFDTLSVTDEDRRRGEMYRQQVQREIYLEQNQSASLEEFYSSLEIVVTIREASDFALPRIAQLSQRTNQFNFTTRRYSENEVQALATNPNYRLYSLQLQDKFGDLGIVGAAIIREELGCWELENFLMSCRALGRSVEDAFFAYLVDKAEQDGARLTGCFRPTQKNAPTRGFLSKYGLEPPEDWQGESWEFKMPISLLQQPSWIKILEAKADVRI